MSIKHIIVLLLLCPGLLHAAGKMTVIADHGGMSALPYYESLNIGPKTAGKARSQMPRSNAGVKQMFPLTSELTPGNVQDRSITLPSLAAPIFIVGDDAMSMAWLRKNSKTLIDLQAIGWAVSVRDQASLDRIKAEIPGLAVQPIRGDGFARRLGLRNYPVLITRSAIEQ